MTTKDIFSILKIGETKDQRIIKTAYREQLVHVNPEDDPEGFKRLRSAYEEAIDYANHEDEVLEVKDRSAMTPVALWLENVDVIYSSLSSRTDVEKWRELFEYPICSEIETADEAKEGFLNYLMQHFRLPVDIWQLILATFNLTEDKEALYELFPVGFIDFVIEDPQDKSWLDFDLFTASDQADIDGYIDHFLSLREMNRTQEFVEAEQAINLLINSDIQHPLGDIEVMLYHLYNDHVEEARDYANKLYEQQLDDLSIQYYIAYVDSKTNNLERSKEGATAILDVNPKYYGAVCLMGSYYLKNKAYEEAKQSYISMLEDYPYDQTLLQGMREANDGIIESYQMAIDANPEDKQKKLDLGMCYYQNEMYNEAIEVAHEVEPDESVAYDYYNLTSRTYMAIEQYDTALPYLKHWLEEIEKTVEDGTEETSKKIKRKSLAHYFLSKCYETAAPEGAGYSETFETAKEHIEQAIAYESSNNYLLPYYIQKSILALKENNYETCITTCNTILEIDPNYYSAILYRQKANFALDKNQEVIDDYYRAVQIYPQGQMPYGFAIKVFMKFDMYEDVKNILHQADENEVQSNELSLQSLVLRRKTCTSDEEIADVVERMEAFKDSVEEEPGDMEDITNIYFELAECYYDMNEYDKALMYVDKTNLSPENYENTQLRGTILFHQDKYDEAVEIYNEMIETFNDYAYAYTMSGMCYQKMNHSDKAIERYNKVIELAPDDQYVHYRMMEIYSNYYVENYEHEYYEQSVAYGEIQIEKRGDYHDYIKLATVHLEAYNFDKALENYKKVIELSDDYAYAYNQIGYVNMLKENYEEAKKYFQLAIDHSDENYTTPYKMMATLYRKLRQYDKSIDAYEKLAQISDNPMDTLDEIAVVYSETKQWKEAIKTYERIRALSNDDELNYLKNVCTVYLLSDNQRSARKTLKKMVKQFPGEEATVQMMAKYCFFVTEDKEEALKHYKEAEALRKESNNGYMGYLSSSYQIITTLGRMNKNDEVLPYIEETMAYLEDEFGSEEMWLNDPNLRKVRLHYLATWYYYLGDLDKARSYLDKMKKQKMCYHCVQAYCFEQCALEGMIYEADGELELAKEKYEMAYDICPDNFDHLYLLKKMDERIN